MEVRMGKGLSIFLVILVGFFCSSLAYKFYVGAKDGWTTDPSENYNHWAERNRFQVNDSLIFEYKKGYDSVLLVRKDDYYKCYKAKPLQSLKDGESGSEFKFERSGPFFFISGHSKNCEKGQKLVVVVLSPRTKSSSPHSQSPSPSPVGNSTASSPPPPPKAHSPISHRTAPAPSPSAASSSGGSAGCSLGWCSFVMTMVFAILFS